MKLGFEEGGVEYQSEPQKVRNWSEAWLAAHAYCPNCDAEILEKLANNRPVADFVCPSCSEEYELKSTKGRLGRKVPDGAYRSMLERLESNNNPSLFLLTYDKRDSQVTNLAVVPKHFFVPAIIEGRKPLAATARRAGWVGCNILIDQLPDAGKIFLVRDGAILSKQLVRRAWQETKFLRQVSTESRGWLIEVLKCVELIGRAEFSLTEVYQFEGRLKTIYPENTHVREKMRQQLQVLRDRGVLEFVGRGTYRLRN